MARRPEPAKKTPSPVRLAAERHGRRSETLASLALRCKFYRLLGRRVMTKAGEIDLIALSPSGVLCFIEVKARADAVEAGEAIGARQRTRIQRAAALYLGARPALRQRRVRFDAILVVPRRWPRHMKDAWRPEIW
jgi:putative endonuclease